MADDFAHDVAIYQALKAADEVAAALQAHLIEDHGGDPERADVGGPAANSLRLLRQARERLGTGLRSLDTGRLDQTDSISLRNR